MKHEEKLVYEFLINRDYKNIQFEPLGKSKFPDFSIENNIGVEVRRLNKLISVNKQAEPIEKLEYKLEPKLKEILSNLTDETINFSVWVSIEYERPVKLNKILWKEISSFIIKNTNEENFNCDLQFNSSIKFRLHKINEKRDYTFHLAGMCDKDKGGIIQDDRYESIKFCLNEKTKRIKPVYKDFSRFWLILVDYIYSHVDNRIISDLSRYPKLESEFDKIIIISRFNTNAFVELK